MFKSNYSCAHLPVDVDSSADFPIFVFWTRTKFAEDGIFYPLHRALIPILTQQLFHRWLVEVTALIKLGTKKTMPWAFVCKLAEKDKLNEGKKRTIYVGIGETDNEDKCVDVMGERIKRR